MKTMTILALATAALTGCTTRDAERQPPTEQDYDEINRAMAVVLERQLSPANGITRTSGEIALGRAPA